MKKSEAVLLISKKLQKSLHLMKSKKMIDNPKMLCDNLALRVLTELEEIGMKPPYCGKAKIESYEWEKEDDE